MPQASGKFYACMIVPLTGGCAAADDLEAIVRVAEDMLHKGQQ